MRKSKSVLTVSLAHINLQIMGQFKWFVDVPDTVVAATEGWFIRFLVEDDSSLPVYDRDAEDGRSIRTPGFRIGDTTTSDEVTDTTTSDTTSTTSSTALPSPTTSALLDAGTASAAIAAGPANNGIGMKAPGGLSEGAKAGIGAGVGIGVASLFAIAALLWLLNRKKRPVQHAMDSKYESLPSAGELSSAVSPGSTYVSPHASVGYYAPVLQKGHEHDGAVEMSAARSNGPPVEMA
jgi:hypothetical protein